MSILLSTIVMGIIGLLFALFLIYANKKFHVEIDPKISEIEEALPGANCSGCGYASCSAYAEAIVKNGEEVNKCVVGGPEVAKKVAEIMGVVAEEKERQIAVVMCRGDNEASKFPGVYKGIKSCAAAIYSQDVAKRCKYGCVGLGDCEEACPFDAIHVTEKGIPEVDAEKCTGCGACVEACPRDIIELHPISQKVFVYCKSKDPAIVARSVCKNACIGCGICVRNATADGKPEAIKVIDNLAVINFDNYQMKEEYTNKCPTKAINVDKNVINK